MKKNFKDSFLKLFSVKKVFSVQALAVLGMLAALKVVLTLFTTIYLTPSFRLTNLNYLTNVVVGFLYGPIPGLAFGAVTDIVTYFVKPFGPFNIGYTISEMVMCFIYGCFLYNVRPAKLWRVIAARALVVVIVFFGLNFLWESIMHGASAGKFYSTLKITKNLALFPLDVALSFGACKLTEQVEKKVFKRQRKINLS